MALSRTAAIAFALSSSVVLLAGCSDPDSTSDAGSAATPPPDAAVTWADAVCSASTELRDSVRDAVGALQLDPAGTGTSLDQARTQVRERVAAVQQAAASLESALSAVPTGADPGLAAARQQLQAASQRAQDAVDQLRDAAIQVADADAAAEVALSLATLRVALAGTATDLRLYLESLRSTVNGSEQALRNAFGATPACQQLTASAPVMTA